jgi:NADH/F420H2 dehydrogenase subunit C
MKLNIFVNSLVRFVPKYIESVQYDNNAQLSITATNSNLKPLLFFLKNSSFLQFKALMDVFGVDYLQKSIEKRYEISYYLLSHTFNDRIRIKLNINENDEVYSIISLFKSAGWLEREVWDMYGLYFSNHTDLRRILTDYGFRGFPLRKDFPLTGYSEVRYSERKKRVIVKQLKLSQEYRYFEFQTPWDKFFNK